MEMISEAERLEGERRTQEAVEQYEAVIEMHPGSPANVAIEFRIADIYSYIRHENWVPDQQEAKRRYEAIVAKYDPTRAEVIRSHKWLGEMYSREGDYVRAREHYQAVADAKELLDSRPELFHEIDALWAELISLDIEQNLASVQKREREQAEQLAAAETAVPPTSGPEQALQERTGPTFTSPLAVSDRGSQARLAEKARTDETSAAERAMNRVPRMRVLLAALALGVLVACFAVVVRDRWTQMRARSTEAEAGKCTGKARVSEKGR
jgi:tetratricopeptide (TPR) repeat protein